MTKSTFTGGFYIPCRPNYDQNYSNVTEADGVSSFSNSFQSLLGSMDPFNKFTDNQFMKYATAESQIQVTTAESQVQATDRQENLVSSLENDHHGSCDGLLQHVVDTSAAISTSQNRNEGSENDNLSGNVLDFDLNKTPEPKQQKRRKHRPKVIVEGKPKRTPNAATKKKKESNENPPQKRKYVRKKVLQEGATPQADVIETFSSAAPKRKSCKKALNFDLEESKCKDQNKTVDLQGIQERNGLPKELPSAASICYDTNSTFLLSKNDGFTVENQQPRSTDDGAFLLHQKLSARYLPMEQPNIPLSANTEMQIKNLTTKTENGPAQGNAGLCKERSNGCLEQCIHADRTESAFLQSKTCLEFPQMKENPMSKNILNLVPNILSNCIEESSLKRKYCHADENQYVYATDRLDSSLSNQEIFQVHESCNGTPLDKNVLKTQKRRKTQNKLGSQKVRRNGKNKSQTHLTDETSSCIAGDGLASPGDVNFNE